MGKRFDIKIKKYDAKKEHYAKFLKLFFEIIQSVKNSEPLAESKEAQAKFFDAGSSLAIFGSRKMYKLYVLSRNLDGNPLLKSSKYYSKDIIVYIYAKIILLIRKEVGLNGFDTINGNEILAFFINDLGNNPVSLKKYYNMEYKIKMVKAELFFINVISFVHASALYNTFIRPLFSIIFLLFKYILVLPIIRLFMMMFKKESNVSG
jgi:hypothetical protein